MKKTILIVALLVGFVASGVAQSRSIGLRSFQEVSYQHGFGSSNMLEIDGGFFNTGLQATATYNWLFPIDWDYEGSWNWYVGPGAYAGIRSNSNNNNGLFIGAAGMIGIEYNFWFPLQLSIDYRPTIALFNSTNMPFGFYSNTFGLGVRYIF